METVSATALLDPPRAYASAAREPSADASDPWPWLPFGPPHRPSWIARGCPVARRREYRWLMDRLFRGLSDLEIERAFGVRRVKGRRRVREVHAPNRFTVRLSDRESQQLHLKADEEACTPSDLVRDALYECYRIGELEAVSDAASVGRPH